MHSKESSSDGETGGRDAPVEQAGETTAADTVSGPEHTKPVGADTMVKVEAPAGAAEEGRQE